MKTLLNRMTIVLAVALGFSCQEEIPDCPNSMCLVAGGWRLTEIYMDDEQSTEDFRQYSLVLNMPENPGDVTSVFNRVQANGTSDYGLWSLQNNDEILRLMPDGGTMLTEDWIIKTLTPRKLVLFIERDTSIKEGPGKIEMVLEPF